MASHRYNLRSLRSSTPHAGAMFPESLAQFGNMSPILGSTVQTIPSPDSPRRSPVSDDNQSRRSSSSSGSWLSWHLELEKKNIPEEPKPFNSEAIKARQSNGSLDDMFNRLSFGSDDGPARNTRSSFSKASDTLESIFDDLSLSNHGQPEPSSSVNNSSSPIGQDPSRRTSLSSNGSSNKSPSWNLGDRFDKDPSVGAMIRGQEFVKQHYPAEPSLSSSESSSPNPPESNSSRASFSSPGSSDKSPSWNLGDRFDKDPSVGAMIQGQEFVKQHYQTSTYPGKGPVQQTPPRRVSCGSSISSWSINSRPPTPEGKEFRQVVLDPFSKEAPSPIKKEVYQQNWSEKAWGQRW